MARQIIDPIEEQPGDGGGNPTPSDPAAPPGSVSNPGTTSPNTKLAKMVFGTATQFTADEIKGAGGPWKKFRVRITAVNNSGRSDPVDYVYSVTEQPPSMPSNFTATNGSGAAVISWRNPTDSNFGYTRLFRASTFNRAPWAMSGTGSVPQNGIYNNLTSAGAFTYVYRPKVVGGVMYVQLKKGNTQFAFVGRDQGGAFQPAWWDFDNNRAGSGNSGGFVTWTKQADGSVIAALQEGTGSGGVGIGVSNADGSGNSNSGQFVQITMPFQAATKIGNDIVGGLGAVQSVNDSPGAGTYIYYVQAFSNTGLASSPVGPKSAVIS